MNKEEGWKEERRLTEVEEQDNNGRRPEMEQMIRRCRTAGRA